MPRSDEVRSVYIDWLEEAGIENALLLYAPAAVLNAFEAYGLDHDDPHHQHVLLWCLALAQFDPRGRNGRKRSRNWPLLLAHMKKVDPDGNLSSRELARQLKKRFPKIYGAL
jgi:hypothetical protein